MTSECWGVRPMCLGIQDTQRQCFEGTKAVISAGIHCDWPFFLIVVWTQRHSPACLHISGPYRGKVTISVDTSFTEHHYHLHLSGLAIMLYIHWYGYHCVEQSVILVQSKAPYYSHFGKGGPCAMPIHLHHHAGVFAFLYDQTIDLTIHGLP